MRTDDVDLAALLGSRICHDLISPIGAIGNGLELLGLSGVVDAPEFDLVNESVQSASARIRFFRVAFGAADADQSLGRAEIAAILHDVTEGGRLRIDWRIDGPLPRPLVKLAFLLIMCAETGMPWGGELSISRLATGWTLSGESRRLKIDPTLWDTLIGEKPLSGLGAGDIQFPLAAAQARDLGLRIRTDLSDTRLTISF